MSENLIDKEKPILNDWKEVVNLPVVAEKRPWNTFELEEVIRNSVEATAYQSLKDNSGQIFTTLSGGVDSTFCLALVAESCHPDTVIQTFTIGSSANHPDIQYARMAAKLYHTTHHEIIIDTDKEREAIEQFRIIYKNSSDIQDKIAQGDVGVWLAYKEIAKSGAKSVIAHDGIDEQMGGYWLHRKSAEEGEGAQEKVFETYWQKLASDHLILLEQTANDFGIKLLFPYLQKPLVEYIAHIPVADRASFKSGKMPLKEIAKRYFGGEFRLGTIPDRKKLGFISALLRNNL